MPGEWGGEAYAGEAEHHRAYDDWFLDRLPPERDDTVLDLGCGSREFTRRIADVVTRGRVIGVEPDPSMLEAARRKDHPRVEFIKGTAGDLAQIIDHQSVDLVVSRAMLHWLPLASYPRVFEAVRSVLRPGGWFHSESAAAGNVPRVVALVDDLAAKFEVAPPPRFPDPGVAFDLLEVAAFDIPAGGVRAVAQRRQFERERMVGFVRTQATVAITRAAPETMADAIVEAAVADSDRLRRHDGTFDQTFVRLEIIAQRPE